MSRMCHSSCGCSMLPRPLRNRPAWSTRLHALLCIAQMRACRCLTLRSRRYAYLSLISSSSIRVVSGAALRCYCVFWFLASLCAPPCAGFSLLCCHSWRLCHLPCNMPAIDAACRLLAAACCSAGPPLYYGSPVSLKQSTRRVTASSAHPSFLSATGFCPIHPDSVEQESERRIEQY
jgi:hypothetical protein